MSDKVHTIKEAWDKIQADPALVEDTSWHPDVESLKRGYNMKEDEAKVLSDLVYYWQACKIYGTAG